MESIEDKINTINQLYLNLKHKHHKALNDAEEAFDKIKISLDHNIYCSQILENQIKVFKELRRQVSEAEKTSDNYQVLNMSAIKERYLLEDVLKKYKNLKNEQLFNDAEEKALIEAEAKEALLICQSDLIGLLMDKNADKSDELINEASSLLG